MTCAARPQTEAVDRLARFRAMTLVEMLVSTTLTLILMGAVAQVFSMFGKGVNGSRSVSELNERMRAAAYRLRQDLNGLTVDTTLQPPMRASLNNGYLEVIEGPETDRLTYLSGVVFDKSGSSAEPYLTAVGSDDRLVGDIDDVILLTTRSTGEMFTGKADSRNSNLEGGNVRSPVAEVIWFCRPTANTLNPRSYTLHRRQRLVAAHPGCEPFVDTNSGTPASNTFGGPPNTLPFSDWTTIYKLTDVSVRRQGNVVFPNCLGDLTRRENRFLHSPTFPHEFPHPLYNYDPGNHTFENNPDRFGEDVILTNVIGFDVRVWDPDALIQAVPANVVTGTSTGAARLAVEPGDPGYVLPGSPGFPAAGTAGYGAPGAYVDLAWAGTPSAMNFTQNFPLALTTPFQGFGKQVVNRGSANTMTLPTYDTWSDYYEINGIDDNNDGIVDNGTNGNDDNGNSLIDEPAEQETSAPYPVPLQQSSASGIGTGGVQIRLRCYEPSSRQVRQITVLQQL